MKLLKEIIKISYSNIPDEIKVCNIIDLYCHNFYDSTKAKIDSFTAFLNKNKDIWIRITRNIDLTEINKDYINYHVKGACCSFLAIEKSINTLSKKDSFIQGLIIDNLTNFLYPTFYKKFTNIKKFALNLGRIGEVDITYKNVDLFKTSLSVNFSRNSNILSARYVYRKNKITNEWEIFNGG